VVQNTGRIKQHNGALLLGTLVGKRAASFTQKLRGASTILYIARKMSDGGIVYARFLVYRAALRYQTMRLASYNLI